MSDLSNLKVGDPVTIFRGGWGAPQTTRTQVVEVTRGGNYKFEGSTSIWTKNGNERGSGAWARVSFDRFDQKVWDEIEAQHQEQRDRIRFENTNFRKLPIETVRNLLAVLDAAEKGLSG